MSVRGSRRSLRSLVAKTRIVNGVNLVMVRSAPFARVRTTHDFAAAPLREQAHPAARIASIRSQRAAAMSGPPNRFNCCAPVGEVTLISVR